MAPQKEAPGPERPSRLFLVLSPQSGEPSEALSRGLAELMHWDLFSARLRLKHPAPATLRVFEHPEQAQEFNRRLALLGLDAYLIREAALSALSEKQIALSARLQGQSLEFSLEAGGQRQLPFPEMFLLVRGRGRLEGELGRRLGSRKVPEVSAERDNFFDRLIARRQSRKAAGREEGLLVPGAATEVELLDLYARDDHHAVRIIESRFDFAPLFGPEFRGRLLGMAKFAELLSASAPGLALDDGFNAIAYTYRGRPHEKKKLNLARPLGRGKTQEKLYSPEALFNEYSALSYLSCLRRLQKG